jgi:hypothetical protein
MQHVPYASVVGILMYEMVCNLPYISHVVGVLRRYMSTPGKEHLIVVKRLFRYLCGTKGYAICYQGKLGGDNGKVNVHGFFHADWDGDLDRHKLTNEYAFNMFVAAIS